MLPKITLIIPVLNGAQTLERTLDSIRRQEYPNLEIIASDGASNDGTLKILEHADDVITNILSGPDTGSAQAINRGFIRSTGEIEGWLCSDDALAEGALKNVAKCFVLDPGLDVLTGGCTRYFPKLDPVITRPDDKYFEKLTFVNTIEQPSTFWRRHVRLDTGPLNERMKYAFDWEYWCRFKANGHQFTSIPDLLSEYHFSDSNLTTTGGRKIIREMYQIIREYGPHDGRLADIYKILYHVFDLNGFYDEPGACHKPRWQQAIFHASLRLLYNVVDRSTVNSYNWNWCSKRERGF